MEIHHFIVCPRLVKMTTELDIGSHREAVIIESSPALVDALLTSRRCTGLGHAWLRGRRDSADSRRSN